VFVLDDGRMADYLGDPDRQIPKAHVKSVCKRPGNVCRYLMKTLLGHVCVKHCPLAKVADKMVADGTHRASGDNCAGLGGE
jgi:hypothetical protein